MTFTLLLLILSLTVIVPTAFVIRGKSRQQKLTHNNQHQRAITHNAKGELHKARPDLKISNTISDYRNNPKLPISFRQLLGKIQDQYTDLAAVQLAPDQRFTVDKLAGTRLPEVLRDYLALDETYAQNTVIDTVHNLTSKDVTYGQLSDMLAFMQRVADDGQGQVASNILANRSYLQSVYGEFYQDEASQGEGGAPVTKAPKDEYSQEVLASEVSLYARGESYLKDCDDLVSIDQAVSKQLSDQGSNNPISASQLSLNSHKEILGTHIISELGQLVTVAERILMYTDALLPSTISLQAFDRIISQSIPNLLRHTIATRLHQDTKTFESANNTDTNKDTNNSDSANRNNTVGLTLLPDQQALIAQKIIRFGQLLEECLTSLERVANQQNESSAVPSDTLQWLQNTISSKQSQAQYLLDSGFFNAN